MATEDFTTYTETDPLGVLTVTAGKVTMTAQPRSGAGESRVFKDFTASHFSGDFEHLLEVQVDSDSSSGLSAFWSLANTVDDWNALLGSGPLLCFHSNTTDGIFTVREKKAGETSSLDSSTGTNPDTRYYCEIERDESIGSFGQLSVRIYSDSGRTTLVDTISVTLKEAMDFRLLFVAHSFVGGSGTTTGFVENLDLQEGGDITLTPDAAALSLAVPQPTLALTRNVSSDASVVSLSPPQPTLAQTATIQPDPAIVTLAAQQPTLDAARDLTPDPAVVTFAVTTPAALNASLLLSPDTTPLTLQPFDPVIVTPGAITPDPVLLTVSASDPSLDAAFTLTPDATQVVFTVVQPLAAATEGWYFRGTAGAACGPGSRFALSLTPDSSPISANSFILIGPDAATWNRTETLRSIAAGIWKVRARISASVAGRSCRMVIERRNAGCVVQETVLDVARSLETGAAFYEFEVSNPIIHFAAGDILTIRVGSSHLDTTVSLTYNRLNTADDTRLIHPIEIPPVTLTPDAALLLFSLPGVSIVSAGAYPSRRRIVAIRNSPRLALDSGSIRIYVTHNAPRLIIDIEG